jgi:hypothetical protein
MKMQYGMKSRQMQQPLTPADAEEDEEEDETEPEPRKPLLRSGKEEEKKRVSGKIANNSTTKAKTSQQVPVTPAKLTTTPANKSKPNIISSGAVFDDDTPVRARRKASSLHTAAVGGTLVLDKLPTRAEINRMMREHKLMNGASGRDDTDGATTDAEETLPTPCPPRATRGRPSNITVSRKGEEEDSDLGVKAVPRPKSTPRKSVGKPLAYLGALLGSRLSKATRPKSSKYRESVSFLGESMSEDEDLDLDQPTPTKNTKAAAARRLSAKTTTPKNINRFFPSSVASHKIADSTPLRRPKKGRPSYTAKVEVAPVLDLGKSGATSTTSSMARKDELAVTGILRSTPAPETDTEYSGTEGNLTPASVRAFAESSSPLVLSKDLGDEDEDEMENDGGGAVVLDESTMPMSQPVSPSKHALTKSLPEQFRRFVEPQKRLVMKMLRSPPFIDVVPPVLDERAPVEATAYHQLSDLLKGTCERGEGNSCLLLGPRGSGKTLVSRAVEIYRLTF